MMAADPPDGSSPVLTWADVIASDLCGMSEAAFDRVAALRRAARAGKCTGLLAAELVSRDPLLRTPLR